MWRILVGFNFWCYFIYSLLDKKLILDIFLVDFWICCKGVEGVNIVSFIYLGGLLGDSISCMIVMYILIFLGVFVIILISLLIYIMFIFVFLMWNFFVYLLDLIIFVWVL